MVMESLALFWVEERLLTVKYERLIRRRNHRGLKPRSQSYLGSPKYVFLSSCQVVKHRARNQICGSFFQTAKALENLAQKIGSHSRKYRGQ